MDTSEKFIRTASKLMETQGYHATGLNQIIAESGAPRGSLYYHFPGGKEELASQVITRNGKTFARLIMENMQENIAPADSVREFIIGVAGGLEATGFQSGGPLTTIALETANTSDRLNHVCREAYQAIQEAFSQKLHRLGISEEDAPSLAEFIMIAIEGGILLSRTRHSNEPLKRVANTMHEYLGY